MAAYAQYLDELRFDDWTALFAEDGAISLAGREYRGHRDIRAWIEQATPKYRLVHMNNASFINVEGSSASATTDFTSLRVTSDDVVINAVGRYRDKFEKGRSGWLFSQRQLELIYRRPDP